ncbi:MAG TPA: hypothetical protein VMG12_13250, partial [Polyangiaceae bacterium]|nr:hypothetical protein [Polyangiaceae bacterium]
RPSEPLAASSPRPPASRPRTVMVVSPVSLTQEEVQPGARPKMPTLLGLGAAMDAPPAHSNGLAHQQRAQAGAEPARQSDPVATKSGVFPPPKSAPAASDGGVSTATTPRSPSRRAKAAAARSDRHDAGSWLATPAAPASATPSSPSHAIPGLSVSGHVTSERRGFDALALQVDVDAPRDIVASVELLADFSLKLSLGPVSRQWVPDVRRSVEALLLTGKHRNETALVALSTRLLEVLPSSAAPVEPNGTQTSSAPTKSASEDGRAPDAAEASPATALPEANASPEVGASPDASASSAETSATEASTPDEPTPAEPNPAEPQAVAGDVSAPISSPEAGAAADAHVTEAGSTPAASALPTDAALDESATEPPATADAIATDVVPVAALSPVPVAALSPAPEAAAAAPPSVALDGALRERILHEVSRLAGVLPEWPAPAQDLAEEARRRETQVMRQLLEQVDGLRRDQRARLEEQMRLEDLANMSPMAIAEEFDAPLERASELQRVLDAYRQERQTRAPDVGNAAGLCLALDALERQCSEFDDCDQEQKEAVRVLRAKRRQALSAVNLLLAERGELEWLEQLEPLAIGERVERLKQWLEGASVESGGDSAGGDDAASDAGHERAY